MIKATPRREVPRAYDPQTVEQRIYDFWLEGGYFTPVIDRSRNPFVVIMPPPNVTGELHVGHALTLALEDLMVRWHRMKGEPTLFLPGTDHAGIATQWVVERNLARDNLSRHDLGRESFVERVWDWVGQYGNTILEQMKRLGASCDWTRLSFTLDPGPSLAVRTTFVNLYKKGLIYKKERITNWCPRCSSALSDLEVKYWEESAQVYYVRYQIEGADGFVTVATTRPETILGDTGVAVHPDDKRYACLVSQKVTLPVLSRVIPIVSDEAVDPDFGTGVLKVTPGHDPADFEIGQRHQLPIISVMNRDGTMNEKAGRYQGLERLECRKEIVDELNRKGLLEKTEPFHHSVGHCDRCNEVVEPMVTEQWYAKMEPLAKAAKDAVTDGRIEIVPERFGKVYFNWMDNIRDWCISRQIWWGHRIPVWYCENCGEVIVEYDDPTSCGKCSSESLYRDPDVLDTWFSSGLWPHSTLGWPDKTEDLDYFYPTSVLETGYDILFFWVARMIMMGIENMDQIPFQTVYLHGLVLDPQGVRMSKTKGNVMDPLELVDTYGGDALRFALTTGNSAGNNMRLNEQKLEASRNFANKLWNAARFVMSSLDCATGLEEWDRPKRPIHRQDRWIMSRLNRTSSEVQRFMDDYQFGEAQRAIHDFLWNEYCDWYIEMSKTRMRSREDVGLSPVPVLVYVLESLLRLLHPFMPFVTEEIWQMLVDRLPEVSSSPKALIVAAYPEANAGLFDDSAEMEVGTVIEIVRAVRNIRAEFRIQPTQDLEALVYAPKARLVVESESSAIRSLARVEPLNLVHSAKIAGSPDQVTMVLSVGTVTVPLAGLVDIRKEKDRLSNELNALKVNHARLSKMLSDDNFLSKAPENVVERERERLDSNRERRARIEEVLSRLSH